MGETIMARPNGSLYRPHAEEPRMRGVSKHEGRRLPPSFETAASPPPQDEDGTRIDTTVKKFRVRF